MAATRAASFVLGLFRSDALMASATYSFGYDLQLLHSRIAEHLGVQDPALCRADRALGLAAFSHRLRWGRGAMRRLEAARAALVDAAQGLPSASPVRAECLGHLEALPEVWRGVAHRHGRACDWFG